MWFCQVRRQAVAASPCFTDSSSSGRSVWSPYLWSTDWKLMPWNAQDQSHCGKRRVLNQAVLEKCPTPSFVNAQDTRVRSFLLNRYACELKILKRQLLFCWFGREKTCNFISISDKQWTVLSPSLVLRGFTFLIQVFVQVMCLCNRQRSPPSHFKHGGCLRLNRIQLKF